MWVDTGVKFHFDNYYWENPKQFNGVSLYQIGDLSCYSGYEVGPHIQPCYEITYILSGKGMAFTNGVPYAVSEGDVFLSLPNDEHNLIADENNPFRYLYLAFAFNQSTHQGVNIYEIEKTFHTLDCPVVNDYVGIKTSLQNALQEWYELADNSQYMIESYILQIIILTYRNICGKKNQNIRQTYFSLPNSNQEIVHNIVTYIDQHLYAFDNLHEVAEALNYSYSHLSHIFHKETGITLQAYYHGRRMTTACELLKAGSISISVIAEKLRYQSIHSFSKAFKKNYGISPAQYRCFKLGKHQE